MMYLIIFNLCLMNLVHTRISQLVFFYNIVKQDKNKYDIQIALAGFNKKILRLLGEGILTVSSKKEEKEDTKDGEIIIKVLLKNTFLNLLQL
ncbi:MAG: hypothetical protein CM15mV25_1040 [uncultured marine virus]|nr:MAG: hypothetical protein CM15mV25_1040 [uncultured marine virus]